MEQCGFKMQLKAGNAAKYKQRHDAIWPELVALLSDVGVSDYSIFLDETSNTLFAFLRRSDDHRMGDLAQHPVMQRWWVSMADLMETDAHLRPLTTPMLPMFHLD